jgi:hypothetical protein
MIAGQPSRPDGQGPDMQEKKQQQLAALDAQYQAKIIAEVERYQTLLQEKELLNQKWDEQNATLVEAHEKVVQEITEELEAKLLEQQMNFNRLKQEKEDLIREFEEVKRQLEEDADRYDKACFAPTPCQAFSSAAHAYVYRAWSRCWVAILTRCVDVNTVVKKLCSPCLLLLGCLGWPCASFLFRPQLPSTLWCSMSRLLNKIGKADWSPCLDGNSYHTVCSIRM